MYLKRRKRTRGARRLMALRYRSWDEHGCPLAASCSRPNDQRARPAHTRLSAFGDPDDRLAGGASVGGERSGRFGKRAYRANDRLEPSVPDPLDEAR